MTWQDRTVRQAHVAPIDVLAHPRNWRAHPQHQQAAMVGVLNDIGWIQDVIVNERTGFLIDGHLRVALALKRKEPTVPVKYVDLSEAEELEALATFDPITALATAERETLKGVLEQVQSDEAGVQALLASLAEQEGIVLDGLGDEPQDDPGPDIDRAEELREQWGVELGQVWELGEHRVVCGDCTDKAIHELLLIDDSVKLVLTDPPYGVGVNYEEFEDTPINVRALIDEFMPLIAEWPVILLTPGNRCMWDYPRPAWVLAWVHPAGMGMNPWGFTQFNPILAYGKDPYLANGLGSRPDSLVLAADREGEQIHPTSKPIKVWDWLLARGSIAEGDIVLDPFLGSGTTLIACERLHRKCRGIEIAPGYVAVTLQRWVDMTGKTPKIVE